MIFNRKSKSIVLKEALWEAVRLGQAQQRGDITTVTLGQRIDELWTRTK